MDFLAGVVTIAPALAFALSGTSAFPGVLALAGSEPVLRLIDIAVNHKLSGLLVFLPIARVEVLLSGEKFTEMVGESRMASGDEKGSNVFHT